MDGSLEQVERKKMVIPKRCFMFTKNVKIFRIPIPVKIKSGQMEVGVPGLL